MKLTTADKRLLEELCQQHGVSADKVLKLLDKLGQVAFAIGGSIPEFPDRLCVRENSTIAIFPAIG